MANLIHTRSILLFCLALYAAGLLLLPGCGKKGPLYIAPPAATESETDKTENQSTEQQKATDKNQQN